MNNRQRQIDKYNRKHKTFIYSNTEDDGSLTLFVCHTVNNKVRKAYKCTNCVIGGIRTGLEYDSSKDFTFESTPLLQNNPVINKMAEIYKSGLSTASSHSYNNPQLWEFGGMRRSEYLFFKYCIQQFVYKPYRCNHLERIIIPYHLARPEYNKRQLLFYIRKWKRLNLVSHNYGRNGGSFIRPYRDMGYNCKSIMIQYYRRIWKNTIDGMYDHVPHIPGYTLQFNKEGL